MSLFYVFILLLKLKRTFHIGHLLLLSVTLPESSSRAPPRVHLEILSSSKGFFLNDSTRNSLRYLSIYGILDFFLFLKIFLRDSLKISWTDSFRFCIPGFVSGILPEPLFFSKCFFIVPAVLSGIPPWFFPRIPSEFHPRVLSGDPFMNCFRNFARSTFRSSFRGSPKSLFLDFSRIC